MNENLMRNLKKGKILFKFNLKKKSEIWDTTVFFKLFYSLLISKFKI